MSITTVSDRDLFWLVVIHVVFVVSSVLLALSDRISVARQPIPRRLRPRPAPAKAAAQPSLSLRRGPWGRILVIGGYGAFGARAASGLRASQTSR